MDRVYSRKDGWLVAVLWGSVFALIWSTTLLESNLLGLSVSIILIGSAALILWVLYFTYYDLQQEKLTVRAGPFKWVIPITEIHEISKCSSPLSSPANSLKRLKVVYGPQQKEILISPRNREDFMAKVALLDSSLVFDAKQQLCRRE